MANGQKPLILQPKPAASSYNRVVQYGIVIVGVLVVITYLTVAASRGNKAQWERPDRFVTVNRPLITPAIKPVSPPPREEPPPSLPPQRWQGPAVSSPPKQVKVVPNKDAERRKEALLKALSAKVIVEGFGDQPAKSQPVQLASNAPRNEPPQTLEIPPAWQASPTPGWPQQQRTGQVGRNQEFWHQSSDATSGQYLAASVQPPRSPYQVNAGTILPAILTHAINSDLEGSTTAVVSQDVYDTVTGRYLLIPQGARLFGVYDADLQANQPRLHLAFKTLYFPNGYSLALQGMPSMDSQGFAGLSDQVNRHFFQRYGTAAVLSLITAGIALATHSNQGGGFYYEPQEAAMYGAGQVLGRAAAEDLRRGMNIRPTVTIREAYPFNLTVTHDVTFPGPYPFEQIAEVQQ